MGVREPEPVVISSRVARLEKHQAERDRVNAKVQARHAAQLAKSFPVFEPNWNYKGEFSIREYRGVETAKMLRVYDGAWYWRQHPLSKLGIDFFLSEEDALAAAVVNAHKKLQSATKLRDIAEQQLSHVTYLAYSNQEQSTP